MYIDGKKRCTRCLHLFEPTTENFSRLRTAKDGLAFSCKTCMNAQQRETDAARKEKRRYTDIKRTYGITLTEYQEMHTRQGGVCAICGGTDSRALAVDHDHTTGRVRGLLCRRCNTGLGQLGDSEESIIRVLNYLRGRKT